MLHSPESVDMEAEPDPASARFSGWVVGFPWRVVSFARQLFAEHPIKARSESPITLCELEQLFGPLSTLVDALQRLGGPDPVEVDWALVGVLVALAKHGHGHYLRAQEASLSSRVRSVVASDPSRDWVSSDFERILHLSGATLRRRLADERTTLRKLLREGRLLHALFLLQTTTMPLKRVAFESGYLSPSSFRRNFVARFGVEPSAVSTAEQLLYGAKGARGVGSR